MPNEDPFVGQWLLDPPQSRYELGEPPASGRYHIQPDGDGYLVTMEWETPEGERHKASYRSVPDGIDYPYENPAVAETVSMTRVDERTLDSTSKKGGQIIAHARRVLSLDGRTMTVTQSGLTPDGTRFANLSVYKKQ
jgi:hypothetical protein